MITVLIACGPNSIEIPCRIFENMQSAREYCDPLFAKAGANPEADINGIRYSADLESSPAGKEISAELFVSHYYGCGGPYPFILMEVPFNSKFVCFNLD